MQCIGQKASWRDAERNDIFPATAMALGVGILLLVNNLRKLGRGILFVEAIV
jgi:hypothetical protein